MDNLILHTESLAVGYRNKPLLQNLNLSIETGGLTCLLGSNGVGKSTLLHTITGLHIPLKGKVYIDGKDVLTLPRYDLSRLISVVLSEKVTPVNLTVFDVVSVGRTPYTNWLGKLTKEDKDIIQRSMELVQVDGFADVHIHELSDGEKQRVMIAKALAQDTPLLILDEPTAHLDVSNRVALLSLLRKLAIETNKAILLSTHELEVAIQLADMVWLIGQDGQLFTGTPEDLIIENKFSSAFKDDYVKFDRQTGAFKINHNYQQKIAVKGEGFLYKWTCHAMEKEGYEIVSNADLEVVISDEEEGRWMIKANHKINHINSIEALKKALKYGERPK